MLRACSRTRPPPELVDLFIVLHRLDELANDQVDRELFNVAASLLAKYPDISNREVAKRLGIAANTVRAWKRTDTFKKMLEACRSAFEEGGWQLVWLPAELDYPPVGRRAQKKNAP